jgi:ornithine carbamoyltransferase
MQHFLSVSDFSAQELWQFLHKAKALKAEYFAGGNPPVLKGKVLGMIFQKPSLRTRVSFEVGMLHLGGEVLYLSPAEIGLGKRESVPDVARVMAGYVHGIMARVFDHNHILQLAQYSSVPVINGLSDYSHPCQALTDVFTIWEHFSRLEGLTIAYVGDGNNVAVSLGEAAVILGANFSIATPKGYELPAEALVRIQAAAAQTGVSVTTTHDPAEAVAAADAIYTDVWTSMGQEEETAQRLKVFPPYQINSALLGKAKPETVVLHCLPAHRSEEITDDVADGPQSLLFPQAHNRLHAQKAILAMLLANAQIANIRS